MLVKFLRPRGNCAERLGIVGVKFYGYKRKPPFLADLAIDKAAPVGDGGKEVTARSEGKNLIELGKEADC